MRSTKSMGSICGLEFAHWKGMASRYCGADHLCKREEYIDNPREKNSSGTEENERAAMLPMDVLIEILKRLPGKSLMRFKAVCKLWLFLIMDPAFAELHHINAVRGSGGSGGGVLLIPPYGYGSPLCVVDLKKEPRERTSVLEPFLPCGMNAMTNIVDGLICFFDCVCDKRSMCLYNLTTRERLRLPPAKLTHSCDSIVRGCFLTFDPKKKEYKVLLFQHPFSYCRVERVDCQVLTVGGTDSRWRSLDVSYIDTSFTSLREGCGDYVVCVDGVLYRSVEQAIVAFDVAGEKLEVIDLPEVTIYNPPTIVEAQGCVSFFAFEDTKERCGSIKITKWRLRDRNHKDSPLWTRKVISYQFSFFRPLQRIRCTSLGQVFSVRNPESDECIIDCYDLVTGGHEVLEVNNAQGILYSTHEKFRPMKFSENICPLMNDKEKHRAVY